ncbi:MAG: DCC1-like thiol-disulfide oxidoreductase family protein [Bacteroidales bacterium]
MTKDQLVIFDGVCNLYNGTVHFIIRRYRKKKFSFATCQSISGTIIDASEVAKVLAVNISTANRLIKDFEKPGILIEKQVSRETASSFLKSI